MKYRKKPVIIEAVQLCWKNWSEVCDFCPFISVDNPARNTDSYSDTCGESSPFIEISIPTLEGTMVAKHGDYIIQGVNGEFYPCKPEIFNKTYEVCTMEDVVNDILDKNKPIYVLLDNYNTPTGLEVCH